jgi:hypothetical protein
MTQALQDLGTKALTSRVRAAADDELGELLDEMARRSKGGFEDLDEDNRSGACDDEALRVAYESAMEGLS